MPETQGALLVPPVSSFHFLFSFGHWLLEGVGLTALPPGQGQVMGEELPFLAAFCHPPVSWKPK